jgi:hypothetical protein
VSDFNDDLDEFEEFNGSEFTDRELEPRSIFLETQSEIADTEQQTQDILDYVQISAWRKTGTHAF